MSILMELRWLLTMFPFFPPRRGRQPIVRLRQQRWEKKSLVFKLLEDTDNSGRMKTEMKIKTILELHVRFLKIKKVGHSRNVRTSSNKEIGFICVLRKWCVVVFLPLFVISSVLLFQEDLFFITVKISNRLPFPRNWSSPFPATVVSVLPLTFY